MATLTASNTLGLDGFFPKFPEGNFGEYFFWLRGLAYYFQSKEI